MSQEIIEGLDDLYSLDKKGKIRIYRLTVIKLDSTIEEYLIESFAGILGNTLTPTTCKVRKGKQGRSVLEQAISEAVSLWESKRKEGYKSLIDLSLKADSLTLSYTENTTAEEFFKLLNIKYNTDVHWYKLPMLAAKYKEIKKKYFPYLAQPKYNGVRATAVYDPDLQKVVLVSRGGVVYNIPHISEQLEKFFLHNQNVELDGEIYKHGVPLQQISGAARKQLLAPDWLEYHVFDTMSDKPQQERLNDVRIYVEIIRNQFGGKDIHRVRYTTVHNEEEVKLRHDECVADGHEGLILRDIKGLYAPSFRDNCLIKVKEFEDEEFEVVGCEIDEQRTIGDSFIFLLKNNIDDQQFGARPTGSIQQKEEWYNNIDSFIGKKATVRFQERSTGGLPIQGHVVHTISKGLLIEDIREDI
jgi:ATP-dependent DNA ligase